MTDPVDPVDPSNLPPVDRNPPDEDDSAGPPPGPLVTLRRGLRRFLRLATLAVGDPQAALQFYRDNDGLGESPPGSNCNWITHWFGLGCVAWCCETVSRALNVAFGDPDVWQVPGIPGDYRHGFAYVPSLVNAFRRAGLYEEDHASQGRPATIRPGDPVSLFGQSHTGLAEADLGDGTFLTREGNYSNVIGQHRRSRADLDGVCHVPWGTPAPPAPVDEEEGDDDMRLIWHKGAVYAVDVNLRSPWGLSPQAVDALRGTGLKVGGNPNDDQTDLFNQMKGNG